MLKHEPLLPSSFLFTLLFCKICQEASLLFLFPFICKKDMPPSRIERETLRFQELFLKEESFSLTLSQLSYSSHTQSYCLTITIKMSLLKIEKKCLQTTLGLLVGRLVWVRTGIFVVPRPPL